MKKLLFLILSICLILNIGVFAAPGAAGSEEGFMTGALTAKPDDAATADDIVTLAARLHSFYNEGKVTDASSVEECYAYALENGLIFEELFEGVNTSSYGVSRAETCYVLARAIPEDILSDINGLVLMPDSDVSSLYYEYALRFINSGIVEGLDEYGSFGPTRPVKRYELSEMLKRINNPAERISKNYIEYASDEPFYLINDYLMGDSSSVRGIYNIASGWRYDYTGSSEKAPWKIDNIDHARNGYANTLRDLSKTDNLTISREIYPQKDGELVLETSFHITTGFSGLRIYLEDIDGENIFETGTYSSGLYFVSNGKRTTRYLPYPSSGTYKNDRKYYLYADPWRTSDSLESSYRLADQIRMRMTINLDTGDVNVNYAGLAGTSYSYYNSYSYKLKDGYNGLKKVAFSTGVTEQIEYTVKQVHLYKNYAVNDKFITHKVGSKPYDYTTYGDVTVREIYSDCANQGDFYSVLMYTRDGDDIYARKNFDALGGIVKLESYLLIPEGNDGVYFSANYGNDAIIKVITKDNKFYTADKNGNPDIELRAFTSNCWQCIRIEADTNTQTALIKIDGKVVAENVPFLEKTKSFSRVEVGCKEADGDFEIWFDDVEVHELFYTPDDYVPEPVPLDTGNYLLSMSVCNLWRNGSHYGWSYIEPHAEIQPITGFYDEGNAEAMDWEIKFLAEHGVSTYAMCWYAPTSPASVPIKKPRMIDAHHEGYFNAKYTEYLDFSIMWENGSYGDPGTSEYFKKNIFPLWMDWYFSDPRYFRIEEDGKQYLFLTIYQWPNFRNMCLPAKAGVNSYNANDNYSVAEFNQAEIDAAKLVKWMEEQVVEAGYADGIILCFTNNGSSTTGNTSMLNMAGTDTAIFPYAWGNTAYNVDNQKQFVETYYELAQSAKNSLATVQAGSNKGDSKGLDLLALAAVGFNDIGWAQQRFPLISDPDFEELLLWFRDEYMPRYKNDEDQWKQYFIQFDTWNEYGEGHYIYPTVGLDPIPGTEYQGYGGYGYLEAMAKVFGKNYDEDLHKDLDVVPTQQQKNRISRLYVPNKRMYIRREFLPTTKKESPIPEQAVASLKFNGKDSVKLVSWMSGCHETTPVYNSGEKAIEFTTKTTDPIIEFGENSKLNGVNASECSVLHVKMKTSKTGTPAQMFFRVTTMPKNTNGKTYYSEDYAYRFNLKEANEWHDYYIDLKSHVGFTGTIETIRFDPGSLENNVIYISDFEFLKFSDKQKRTEIVVDSHVYAPTDYWEIQNEVNGSEREEIYIAPTDDKNLYKALHIVYDWNENTGILDLDTPVGKTFRFTVGSDKVLIDGYREVKLAKEFYIYDGAPVIPLLFILNEAEYNYVHDFKTKRLEITVSDPTIFEKFPNFNAEDETLPEAFYSMGDSVVTRSVDPDYSYNHVWEVDGRNGTNSYLLTDASFEKGTEYTLSFDLKLLGLDGGGFMFTEYPVKLLAIYSDGTEVTEHISSAGAAYYGTWNHMECTYTIPENLVKDGNVPEKIGIYIGPDDWDNVSVNYVVDNFTVRRPPTVFQFRNGDAEDEDMSMWFSANTDISRVWDEEMNSWVIEMIPNEDCTGWAYLRQGTRFEAGVTYYYSYDAKMGLNTLGQAVTTSFSMNARYSDLLQSHFTSNVYDHSYTQYGVNFDDGWKHYSGSFTVSSGYSSGGITNVGGTWMDEITWYANPLTINGKYVPMSMRFDNIKFSTTPIE